MQLEGHNDSSLFPEAFHQIAFAVIFLPWHNLLHFSHSFATHLFSWSQIFGKLYFHKYYFWQYNFSIIWRYFHCKLRKTLGPELWLFIFQDVVILNKVDMVPVEGPDTLEDLEKEIHKINSIAEIIRTVRCQVDLSKILDRRAYDSGVSKMLSSSISLYMKTSAGLISFRFFFFFPLFSMSLTWKLCCEKANHSL